jgi:hypothetical protein
MSWMFFIHDMYVLVHVSGTNRVRPSWTAAIASFASGSTFTNHCGDSRGSTTVAQRWQVPIDSACFFVSTSSPCSVRCSSTVFRARKRSSPL